MKTKMDLEERLELERQEALEEEATASRARLPARVGSRNHSQFLTHTMTAFLAEAFDLEESK